MTTTTEHTTLTEQASKWMSRLGAEDTPRWDDPALGAWLSQSPQHREAFAEISAIWFAAEQVLPVEPVADTAAAGKPILPQQRRRWPLLTAAMLALVVALWLPSLPQSWAGFTADFVSRAGQVQTVTLADGSRAIVAGDSAVSLATEGRGLTLHYGEIFLEVAHNPAQPFVVSTKAADVTVLGTRFGVAWRDGIHRAGVIEGRVAVKHSDGPAVELSAGQLTLNGQLQNEAGLAGRYFGWEAGNLVFEDVPLSQVLDRLGPFLSAQVVRVPGAGNPSITAVVAVDGSDQMLETLATRAGLRLLSAGPVKLLY